MTEQLFKVLNKDGTTYHSGKGKWNLPEDDRPGKWMPAIQGKLIPCERGYHLCRASDLVYWLGPTIYEAEYVGDRIDVNTGDSKVVVRKARLIRKLEAWNEQTARLFAVECAERVLPIYERDYPSDTRPREALAVARRFAHGEATAEQLAAARDAAGAAAWAAARVAAWDAAWAAARAARAAAGAAAWVAAWDAAWAAARAAAGAAARAAAGDAAWDAAGDAAGDAAWAAARAARAAAGAAAWDAARAAACTWQSERLTQVLANGVKS